jgi:type I site-specific restriction-modification system R (restriction) subunit
MISEALLETWTLTLLREVGYTVITGADLGPEGAHAERTDYTEVVLAGRLLAALAKLNSNLPADALNDAFQHVVHPELPALVTNNRTLHRMLVDGVHVEYQRPDGTTAGERARLIDYDNSGANDWLVVNQFIVRGDGQLRRPDVVVFVNGLPLAVIELKNPTDAEATTYEAFHQFQTCKEQIPDLFAYNAVLVVSDGVDARIGALTSTFERFLPWRTIEGETTAPVSMPQLQVLIFGVFEQHRFLDLLRYFIVFEDNGGGHLEKKIAAYHQFYAVNRAVESTLAATSVAGSRQCGVVWHTQGSGKSLTMVFYAGRLVIHHIRTKARREALAQRFRDPTTGFKLVIVRDMWLTGFDAPCLHTMYIDKPMRGHGLMQTIARVNRVFRDKPGGLIVDYLGLTDQLQQALNDYTQSGGVGEPAANQQAAIEAMQSKYEICSSLFYGFDWSAWTSGNPGERLSLLPAAQEHIFDQADGIARLNQAVKELSQAHALAMPAPEALTIRDDVAFFQAVRTAVAKTTASGRPVSDEWPDQAVRQLVSRAMAPENVIDVFAVAGIAKPDISILSDEFLDEVRRLPHKRLAVELLRKLLNDELTVRARTSIVQSRSFADMLERSIRAYQHRAIETVQVIEELIELARDLRAAEQRGEALGLSEAELAFYEALEVNDSAVQVLGDETLKLIARELTAAIRRNIAIDWTVRESVRAKMRVLVRRILRKYGYPPDKQEKAIQTVLEQAELLSEAWAAV